MWNRLSHPNIAKFYGISFQLGGRPSLVMQWYENGAAPDYLLSQLNERCLEIVSLRFWHFISTSLSFIVLQVKDVCRGLKYLHTLPFPVVHGDLKGVGTASLCN